MGRWEPDSEQRFRAAALALFGEIGYEHTTVAAIAQRAGLTSRTFFRYFADKREVLFNGSERLQQLMMDALVLAPADASPVEIIATVLTKSGEFFTDELRPFSRLRQSVIVANAELHERELIKLATLAAALAGALRQRGVAEPDASLAAEAGIAVFRVAFTQWVEMSERRGFVEIVNASLSRLKVVAAG